MRKRGLSTPNGCAKSLAVLCLAIVFCGCVQLETRIKLNADGSATVTERFRVLRSLLQIEQGLQEPTGTRFAQLLSRQRAAERLKEMGKGVTLVSHEVRDAEAGSREAVTVYRVADITDLTYASPFLMLDERVGKMSIKINPQYHDTWNQVGGILWVNFRHTSTTRKDHKNSERFDLLTRRRESPRVRQGYRDIAPIFRDLLQGFQVRIVFENYGEILGSGGHAVHLFRYDRPTQINIVNYSYLGETGGRTGTHPLDREENMVDLIKLLFQNPKKNARGRRKGAFLGHHTGRDYANAVIRPSPHYFKKYFEGKKIKLERHRPDIKPGTRQATYGDIGEPGLDKPGQGK